MKKKGDLEKILGAPFSTDLVEGTWEESAPEAIVEAPLITLDGPEQIFEKTFDAELLNTSRKKAAKYKYKQMAGRNDPFDPAIMLQFTGAWSTLIEKTVITFPDACDHAIQLCKLWAQEDKELQAIADMREQRRLEKIVEKVGDLFTEGTKEYEVEQLRIKWREAVRQRNEITAQWNKYVEDCRNAYRTLRDS